MLSNTYQVQESSVSTEGVSSSVGLNSAQLHFLQILSHIKTDETLKDLKRLVRDYYIQQSQKEADKFWSDGKLGDHLLDEHLRTPYK